MTKDHKLRQDRMVFYEDEIERFDQELDVFLEMSGARCALMIDREGHLVTRRGENVKGSLDSIAALIAGSFAATHALAALLGEDEFATLFHQGERESIQVTAVGSRALFAIVFDERSNLGLVRFYVQETLGRLNELMTEMDERPEEERAGTELAADFSSNAAAALDELF